MFKDIDSDGGVYRYFERKKIICNTPYNKGEFPDIFIYLMEGKLPICYVRGNPINMNKVLKLTVEQKKAGCSAWYEFLLIELQVEGQFDYFHRMLFGTSKLITDYMVSGTKYREVRKVVSINIVYFDLGQGVDYIYKGQTEFKGIHKNDLLKLSAMQQKNLPKLDHVAEIFPEYYILKVNDFDNHAVDTLDEWIYVLKNSEVPDGFSAKGLEKAAKELDLMKLSDADRKSYERYIDDCRSAESSMETSWLEGHEKGIEKVALEISKLYEGVLSLLCLFSLDLHQV